MAFFNYNKPGPGVSKDAPEKTAFFRFFEIFGRKFWDLMKINMLYFISCILFYLPAVWVLLMMKGTVGYPFSVLRTMLFYLCLLPIALTGPFTAGLVYILRNFAREEHVFLWSDYKDTVKNNFGQAVLVSLINIIVFSALIFSMQFYLSELSLQPLMIIPLGICLIVLVLFIFIQYYIYLMLVTFDVNTIGLYKNALIFSILGLGRNIVVSVLLIVVLAIHLFLLWPSLILLPFLSFSFMGLMIVFASWPLINRFMMDNNPYVEHKETDEEEIIFEDKGREK